MTIRSRVALLVPAALLAALALLPPSWHLFAGVAAWIGLRIAAGDVLRTLGQPLRWLLALLTFGALGALFAPSDTTILSVNISKAGTLSGVSMVLRAFAIASLTSMASSVLPIRRWTQRVTHPLARRVVEVVVVAANLVPVLVRSLATASKTLKERRPGLQRLPQRLWLLAVHSALRASMLAESVAFDMAIAAHNATAKSEESS